jgi:arylsulfatase
MPTLMELIGEAGTSPRGVDGVSFAPTLLERKQGPRAFLYREFPAYGGWQSIRIGDWKGVRHALNPRNRNAQPKLGLELYNLKNDPDETTDIASKHPDVVARMEKLMREQHTPSELFPFPELDRAAR